MMQEDSNLIRRSWSALTSNYITPVSHLSQDEIHRNGDNISDNEIRRNPFVRASVDSLPHFYRSFIEMPFFPRPTLHMSPSCITLGTNYAALGRTRQRPTSISTQEQLLYLHSPNNERLFASNLDEGDNDPLPDHDSPTSEDWRSRCRASVERWKYMFTSSMFTDVQFVVFDERKIAPHNSSLHTHLPNTEVMDYLPLRGLSKLSALKIEASLIGTVSADESAFSDTSPDTSDVDAPLKQRTITASKSIQTSERLDFLRDQSQGLPETPYWEEYNSVPTTAARFSAHKLVLAVASPVFEAMFYGRFNESTLTNNRPPLQDSQLTSGSELHIKDITPDAFYNCLKYIYYDDLNLTNNIDALYETLYAAKKYLLLQLIEACLSALKNLITPAYVCSHLSRCAYADEEDLIEMCWDIIDIQTSSVLASKCFLELEHEYLHSLLERETLCCPEWEVFEAVRRWTQSECQRRGKPDSHADLMQEFLPLIRFPVMSLEEFAQHVAYSGLLNRTDVCDLFLLLAATKCHRGNEQPGRPELAEAVISSTNQLIEASIKFINRARVGRELYRCSRFIRSSLDASYTSKPADTRNILIFETSSPIFLVGLSIFSFAKSVEGVKVRLTLQRTEPTARRNVACSALCRSTPLRLRITSTQSGHSSFLRASHSGRRLRNTMDNPEAPEDTRSHHMPPDSSQQSASYTALSKKSTSPRKEIIDSTETTVNFSDNEKTCDIRLKSPIRLRQRTTYAVTVTHSKIMASRWIGVLSQQEVSLQVKRPHISTAENIRFRFSNTSSGNIINDLLFYPCV